MNEELFTEELLKVQFPQMALKREGEGITVSCSYIFYHSKTIRQRTVSDKDTLGVNEVSICILFSDSSIQLSTVIDN